MNDVVYLIEDTSGAVKIGITDNITNRMAGLQTSNSSQLVLRYLIHCPSREASQRIEALLHDRYGKHCLQGEWFKIKADDVIKDVKFALAFAPHLTSISITTYRQITTRLPGSPTQTYEENPDIIADQIMQCITSQPDVKMTHKEIRTRLSTHSRIILEIVTHQLLRDGRLIAIPVDINSRYRQNYFVIAEKEVET